MTISARGPRPNHLGGKQVRQRLQRRLGRAWTGSKRTILVSGLQRSGTNMLMDLLDRAHETEVFHENDPRAFDAYIMREPETIHRLIAQSPASRVVVKALQEGQVLARLLDTFAPSCAIWMCRAYPDVVNSQVQRWPGFRNKLELILEDREGGEWRGSGMSDDTYEMLRRHYRPDLSTAETAALFWVYRNQLLFDQGLDRDERVLVFRYENIVYRQEASLRCLADFLDIQLEPSMGALVRASSVGKNPPPPLSPDIAALCDDMQRRLLALERMPVPENEATERAAAL
jgi:hypothetical protein